MTDYEAIKRFIQAFGGYIPSFNEDSYWLKISQGAKWMDDTRKDSPFNELCQKYLRACYEIATIEFEINERGGRDIEQCTKV